MSFEKKRRRFIHELATGRFTGAAGHSVSGLIDEDDLPLPVRDKLRVLRQEIGQLNEALAQRNLDLLECRRELRIMHRERGPTTLQQAVLDAARVAEIRTGMGGAPCIPFFIGQTEADLCHAVLAWRGK